jgi:predicted GIY-YIG superfamily endonuclease
MKSKKIVYVLKEKGTTFYRIGSTHSIEDRLRTLNQGNPRGMELFYSEERTRFISETF